ncbi:hypothetical protein GCK32_014623 [Trichostrongylus colubriformis]|uniref:CC domain-containing protein n=1 Tax=Trichostrongylus colubriformis TaxID=6319 RepID=A0AAN8IFL3_TRICO
MPCSQAGYTCQFSTNLTQYICCGSDPTSITCADGRKAFEQIAGETYSCRPGQIPSSCPYGYECAASTSPGVSVCCATNVDPSIPPTPPSNVHCPAGWDPYRDDVDYRERSCSGPQDDTFVANLI